MRSIFPGHFRPTSAAFEALWDGCLFSVDANVLLNLYRYSEPAREELMKSLDAVSDRIFVPHQAAKEFLKNRLSVTVGQADEYSKAIKVIEELTRTLSNNKRHPFLPDAELPKFEGLAESLCEQLEAQKAAVLLRLSSDEILDYADRLFETKTGSPFDATKLKAIAAEGSARYERDIPPGYRDGKKDGSGDDYRKYGDLIVWKQIIEQAKAHGKPVIFITDDRKDDWWLEQSGRTIGPRPELVEEFLSETGQQFWMYTVDKFLEEISRRNNVPVSQAVINEIIEVSEDAKQVADDSDATGAQEASQSPRRQSNAAFLRPMMPSPELAQIVGTEPLTRTEVVSLLWAYIKRHRLQDAVNKRAVNSDERLLAVFGKGQISMFEMAGLISNHLRPIRQKARADRS